MPRGVEVDAEAAGGGGLVLVHGRAEGAYHRLYWSQFTSGVDPDEDEAVLEGTATGQIPVAAAEPEAE
jgi:hypothetical protein